MIVKLLTEHHLEFRTLKGCCRGLSESTLVKMSNCWKSHAAAHLLKSANVINQCHKTAAKVNQSINHSPTLPLTCADPEGGGGGGGRGFELGLSFNS